MENNKDISSVWLALNTFTKGDDDELMLNVLRCHLTY